jgi:hypothetical protein
MSTDLHDGPTTSSPTTTTDPANRLVEIGDAVREAADLLARAETDLRAALLAARDQLRAGLPADAEVLRSAVERGQAANEELLMRLRSAEVELERVSVEAATTASAT